MATASSVLGSRRAAQPRERALAEVEQDELVRRAGRGRPRRSRPAGRCRRGRRRGHRAGAVDGIRCHSGRVADRPVGQSPCPAGRPRGLCSARGGACPDRRRRSARGLRPSVVRGRPRLGRRRGRAGRRGVGVAVGLWRRLRLGRRRAGWLRRGLGRRRRASRRGAALAGATVPAAVVAAAVVGGSRRSSRRRPCCARWRARRRARSRRRRVAGTVVGQGAEDVDVSPDARLEDGGRDLVARQDGGRPTPASTIDS